MAGSLITAIVAITRKAVKIGAKATSQFVKALAELGKTLGHAPYAPYDINDFECHIKVPKARRSKDPNLQRK